MFTKRKRLALASIVGVALALAGCSAGGGSSTGATGKYVAPKSDVTATLTVSNWGNPGDQTIYDNAIKVFNKKYPHVKVNDEFSQIVNWGDYVNKVQSSIAAGRAPDVINIATEGIEYGLSKKLFLPLDNYIKQDSGVRSLIKDEAPAVMNGFKKSGHTYLLPNNWNTSLMFYNTKLFDAAGIPRPSDDWTWDDFRAAAKKLSTGSGGSQVYGFGIPTQTFALMPWLYSNDASTATPDLKKPALDSSATIQSISFLNDMVKDGIAPNPTGTAASDLFAAGKVAMTNPAGAAGFAKTLAGDPGLSWDVLPMPKNKAAGSVYGAAGFAVYKGSKNQDLAWELTKDLASQQTQKAWASAGGSNPTTLTELDSAEFKKGKGTHPELFAEAKDNGKAVAAPTFFTTNEAAFQNALSAIYGGADVGATLKKAQAQVLQQISNG